MKKEELIAALRLCSDDDINGTGCARCPAKADPWCVEHLMEIAADYIEKMEEDK
ncbi:MAG: hypothetical protein MJZ26_12170 [Fibrobacter sp.]|nr:hypothetical protein [Fibrobacter sp.]